MRLGILGDMGSGKTLVATALNKEYHDLGYGIFANYNLAFPFTKIDGTNFINQIPSDLDDKKYVVTIDEMGLIGINTITDQAVAQMMAQSRKSTGERSHLLLVAQIAGQLSSIIKGLMDIYYKASAYQGSSD